MKELDGFLAKYTPEIQKLARAALARVRKRLPGAVQLVYDNYNALVIAFGPTDRTSDVIFSIVLYPRWVSFFFAHGAGLSDPKKLLKGTGTRVRHIVLESSADLDQPAVEALIAAALKRAGNPIDASARGRTVVKMALAKQRARRPSK
jgi:hypothetical protein